TGLLSGAEHRMKWDGTRYRRPEWNQDQTLRTATDRSAVWYFQRLATQLGVGRERAWLTKIPYGNARVEGDVQYFWLEGSLLISAEAQAEIMRRLWRDELPFSPRNQAIVRDILPAQRGAHGEMRGKTGSDGRRLSWFVGHLVHDGKQWVFATRVEWPGAHR